ncbi:MAG: tail fiber domain-containing protein [Candidatus Pacebacteria bacterium]|nr:tail fiber domain-containing protein [Candidatus Paceibacterota bacterium]
MKENRLLVFTLAFLVTFSFGSYALATFYPGETNDPSCAPGDAGCYVATVPSQTGNNGKFLTTNGTATSWGTFSTGLTNTSGTLTNDLLTGISGGQTIIGGTAANDTLIFQVSSSASPRTAAAPMLTFSSSGALGGAAAQTFASLNPTIAQSGVAGYTALQIQAVETSIGSGSSYLIDALSGSTPTSKFSVSRTGAIVSAAAPTFSTMTLGSVLFSGTDGILSQDNSNFFWDDTNNRLGIGTTSPTTSLEVASGTFLQTQGNNPTIKSTVTDPALAGSIGLDIVGKYAYLANSSNSSFSIVDISNPSAPTFVSSVQELTQLSGAFYTKVAGKYAYVTSSSVGRLTVIDISNPNSPTIVASLLDATNLGGARGLYISGKYAYIGAFSSDRLTIVDISNPASPVVAGTIADSTNIDGADGVYVSGKYAYVAGKQSNSVAIYNISDPTVPGFVGVVSDLFVIGGTHELYVSGKYVYVAAQDTNSFAVIDVSNPASPSIVGSLVDGTNLNSPKGVFVSGRYAYVTANSGNSLAVIDISTPASPIIAGTISHVTNLSQARDVKVVGKYAYVAMNTGLSIIDLNGIDSQGASIGSLLSETINVNENADIGNNLYVRGGLNVGIGGIQSLGSLSLSGLTTSSLAATLDVRNVAGTSLLYVRDDGNVGIGTSSPVAPFEVKGTGTGATIAKFTDVNTTGCTLATGGTISCSSDERLKKNIENISYGLETVKSLRPVVYNWKYEADGTMRSPGFIAQEVESLVPKLVATDLDGYKSLNTTGMVPILAKAIQELDMKIEPLSSLDLSNDHSLASLVRSYMENSANGIRTFFADKVQTKELCLEDVCVTKTELQNLLNNSGVQPSVSFETPVPPAENQPEITEDPELDANADTNIGTDMSENTVSPIENQPAIAEEGETESPPTESQVP